MVFTTQQKAKAVECFFRTGVRINGEWQYSLHDCMTDFREEYPDLVFNYNYFRDVVTKSVQLFRESGSVARKSGSGPPLRRTEATIEAARQIMDEQPKTSIRVLAQQINLSYGTTRTILKKDLNRHAYKLQCFHELLPIDPPRRIEFCNWFQNNLNNEAALNTVFFSDEAWFYLSGYVNSQNMRWWSSENPHFFVEQPLHPQKVGVWVGICRRRLVGPIFFEGTLTAARYRDEILNQFINQLDGEELQNGYFQQDGATAHTTRETLRYLAEFFDNRIISRNAEIPYPTRSCDLNICDFFVWPYIKNSIYSTPIHNLEELRNRITEKCEEINNSPQMLHNVFAGLQRRIRLCLDVNGQHFQQIL